MLIQQRDSTAMPTMAPEKFEMNKKADLRDENNTLYFIFKLVYNKLKIITI